MNWFVHLTQFVIELYVETGNVVHNFLFNFFYQKQIAYFGALFGSFSWTIFTNMTFGQRNKIYI